MMKDNFITRIKKNGKYNHLFVLFFFLFLIGFVGFIYISIGDNDLVLSSILVKVHIDVVWVRYYCKIFFTMGSYQVFDVMPVLVMVIVESLFIKHKYSKKWALYCVYSFMYFGWLMTRIYSLVNAYYNGWGYLGNSLDYEFLIPGDFEFKALLTISVVSFLIVTSMFSYIRFSLSKKPYFMENKYWSRAMASILFVFFVYIIVGFSKQATGRPEYVFNDYENIYGKISKDSNGNTILDLSDLMKNLDFLNRSQLEEVKNNIIKQYDSGWLQPSDYFKWWQINGNFFDNIKYCYPFNIFTNNTANNAPPGWNVNNFPSGHTIGTICLVGYGFTFIYHDNIKKWVKYCFSVAFTAYILHIGTILTLSGSHWAGDVFFSLMLGPCSFAISMLMAEKIEKKIILKYDKNNKIKKTT